MLISTRIRKETIMHSQLLNIIAVFVGGGTGASLRYLITKLAAKCCGFSQWGTFGANILGCFLIGYIFGFTMQKTEIIPPALKLFLTVGFLGGLTTFSTFSCEAFCFLKEGKLLHCALYITASVVLGLFATFAGYLLGK